MEAGTIIFIGVLVLILVIVVFFIIAKTKGKLTINLQKMEYSAGETIPGTINLSLKEPVEANSLKIHIRGFRDQIVKNNQGKNVKNEETVYEFTKPIDGKKFYPAGQSSYDFELKTPSDLKNSTGNKMADVVVNSIQMLSGRTQSRIKWQITATLDMKGFNLLRQINVNIV
jgi:hypothetical protein